MVVPRQFSNTRPHLFPSPTPASCPVSSAREDCPGADLGDGGRASPPLILGELPPKHRLFFAEHSKRTPGSRQPPSTAVWADPSQVNSPAPPFPGIAGSPLPPPCFLCTAGLLILGCGGSEGLSLPTVVGRGTNSLAVSAPKAFLAGVPLSQKGSKTSQRRVPTPASPPAPQNERRGNRVFAGLLASHTHTPPFPPRKPGMSPNKNAVRLIMHHEVRPAPPKAAATRLGCTASAVRLSGVGRIAWQPRPFERRRALCTCSEALGPEVASASLCPALSRGCRGAAGDPPCWRCCCCRSRWRWARPGKRRRAGSSVPSPSSGDRTWVRSGWVGRPVPGLPELPSLLPSPCSSAVSVTRGGVGSFPARAAPFAGACPAR